MDQNINDLMNAAKIKLEAQQKQNEIQQEDIYAELKNEMNYDDTQDVTINNSPNINYNDSDYQIKHDINDNLEENIMDYIDPDDASIFEGGPGFSQIQIWKKQFTKEKIFHTQILEKHFVFRTLNRFEYKQIVAIENIDALHREEIICNTCVLWPQNYNFKYMASHDSGYPSTLAQIIMENSGFTKEYGIEIL
jgi:hypothetical protein